MTLVMKATFPCLPEERNFIQNIKGLKIYNSYRFLQNFLSKPFQTTGNINTCARKSFTSGSNFDNHF